MARYDGLSSLEPEIRRPEKIQWYSKDFKDLPNELKDGVLNYCEKEDMFQLLLTCKKAA